MIWLTAFYGSIFPGQHDNTPDGAYICFGVCIPYRMVVLFNLNQKEK